MIVKRDQNIKMQIERMRDLKSIYYEDLYVSGATGKGKIIPGFLVFYGDGEQLFLTTFDSYFELFVRRLREVYLEEKDTIIRQGVMGPVRIEISDLTKQILLSGDLERICSQYRDYQKYDSYQEPLLFEQDQLKAFFPITEYHLREMLRNFDLELGDMKLSNGINGNYHIQTTIHHLPTFLPVSYKHTEDTYEVYIGNLLNVSIPICVQVTFSRGGINVVSCIPEYNYYAYSDYEVKDDYLVVKKETQWDRKCIQYTIEHLDKLKAPEHILPKEENYQWYSLPWKDAYFGIAQQEEKITEEDHLLEKRVLYVSGGKQYFERENCSKQYYKVQPSGTTYMNMTLDRFDRTTIGVLEKGCRVLETHFSPYGNTGFYKEYLANRYFYGVSPANTWDKVDSCTMYYLNRRDGVEEKVDLLDQKIIMKGMNENGII